MLTCLLCALLDLYVKDAKIRLASKNVYRWGKGALGLGDEIDKTTPTVLNNIKGFLVVQVCARKRKTFVLMDTHTPIKAVKASSPNKKLVSPPKRYAHPLNVEPNIYT